MIKQFIYPESKSRKWLISFFLALSYFAFSLSPVPIQAQQQMPSQIEQVILSEVNSEDELISINQVVENASSFIVTERSREYEKKILRAHQKKWDVAFKNVFAEHQSFFLPAFHTFWRIIPQHVDDDLPPGII